MLHQDAANLRVLYIGGTGTISASCVRLSVETGMRVSVLNRGSNTSDRTIPDTVEMLTGDVNDDAALAVAIGDRSCDAVVNFLSYDVPDARRMVSCFSLRTKQYLHISSASIYAKPVRQVPISESTPTAPNPHLEYATAKWRAAVHGCGTSLWTLTHAEDFAVGLVGLLGNPRTIGETFNITGPDVYTWDQIYTIIAEALGVEAKLVHVASEMYPLVAPEWFWSGEMVGDIGHSAVFDNTKIRTFVPGFARRLTFHRAAVRMIAWRAAHPESTKGDEETDAVLARIFAAYHAAKDVFVACAPATAVAS
jgi:nucleoside-diphosphate-sugar epimerase